MHIDMQDTQPLPRIQYRQETQQERYQRLKALSDRTGVRLLFVYLSEERIRRRGMLTTPLSVVL